jgi:hypothetical protein
MKRLIVWCIIIICLLIGFDQMSARAIQNIDTIETELNNISSR